MVILLRNYPQPSSVSVVKMLQSEAEMLSRTNEDMELVLFYKDTHIAAIGWKLKTARTRFLDLFMHECACVCVCLLRACMYVHCAWCF